MYAWNPILNSLVTHSMSGHADKYLHSSDALGNFNYHNKLTMLMIAQSYIDKTVNLISKWCFVPDKTMIKKIVNMPVLTVIKFSFTF